MRYEDNYFDIITVFTVFSSIINKSYRKKISKEIDRVLKKGGMILYYDLKYLNPFNKNVIKINKDEIDNNFENVKYFFIILYHFNKKNTSGI